MTWTVAELEIGRSCFDDIARRLRDAGLGQVVEAGSIEMHGIVLVPEAEKESTHALRG